LVERITHDGWSVARAAQAAGLSARQAYRWCARYRSGGAAALADRGSAPQHCPHRTPEPRVAEIKRLREEKRLTGPAIARQLGMPVSTVGKLLRRIGLGRLSVLEPKPPVRRYQRERPGELIHIDIKKLGRIEGIGHRITGDRRHRPGAGWEYLHVCIDDASRLAYSEMLPNERKESAVPFLERALDWFAGLGVSVERVMTDNGSAYRSHLWRQACATRRLRHIRTRPYTPRTNGKAERFIQTGLREWAYAQAYPTSMRRQQALATWLGRYNTLRPHSALANQPPAAWLSRNPFLGSTAAVVSSSRPGSPSDRGGGPGQGSPKATGKRRRAASLRRTNAAVTLVPGGTNA
jgi:transposase InsO family protein